MNSIGWLVLILLMVFIDCTVRDGNIAAEIQALIGKAIKNKLLKFSLGSDADAFVKKAKKEKALF